MFIFGEDPLGCAQNKVKVSGWLSVADFVMVQDYFMTETAKHADLILPDTTYLERHDTISYEQYDGQFVSFRQPVLLHRFRFGVDDPVFGNTQKRVVFELGFPVPLDGILTQHLYD